MLRAGRADCNQQVVHIGLPNSLCESLADKFLLSLGLCAPNRPQFWRPARHMHVPQPLRLFQAQLGHAVESGRATGESSLAGNCPNYQIISRRHMPHINDNYLKLKAGYLFPEIARRVKAFAAEHPDAKVIRMGIGDVTEPLPPAVVQAMHKAVDEMANRATFKGYGDEQGYAFLREAVAKNDFQSRNCDVAPDEVFISDGSKCATGNILDTFGD